MEVAISGPNQNDGVNGTYAIPDGSGDQIRSVPVGGANEITVAFGEEVTLSGSSLQLQSALDGTLYSLDFTDPGGPTTTATWTLSNGATFAADQIVLRLDATTIIDADGKQLDGEWVNPKDILETYNPSTDPDSAFISAFPSGDGTAGGDFNFYFTTLPGDLNQDNVVDLPNDLTTAESNFFLGGTDFSYSDGDISGDGVIDYVSDILDIAALVQSGPNLSQWVPQVTSVTISGPNLLDGNSGAYEVPTGDGMQIAAVPIGGADTITLSFSKDIVVNGDEIQLVSARDASRIYDLNYQGTPGIATSVATWVLDDAEEDFFDADQIVLTLSDSLVDANGHTLDGDWTNPADRQQDSVGLSDLSLEESGDGVSGSDFVFYLTFLGGDSNQDNIVSTSTELFAISGNVGLPGLFSFADGDINGDTVVSLSTDVFPISARIVNPDFDFRLWPAPPATSAATIVGDHNGDGLISGSDFLAWQRNTSVGNLEDWRSNYGQDGATSSNNGDGFGALSANVDVLAKNELVVNSLLSVGFAMEEDRNVETTDATFWDDYYVPMIREYALARRQPLATSSIEVANYPIDRDHANESPEEYWLSEELLEKVFG